MDSITKQILRKESIILGTILRIGYVITLIILSICFGLIGALIGFVIGAVYIPIAISDGRASNPVKIVTSILTGDENIDHI